MYYFIAVFKNKSECYLFINLLASYKIKSTIINTPYELHMPCGTSVKINTKDLQTALQVAKRRKFNSFVGFYSVTQLNNKLRILPLNF
jgi:hypothetical protein